MKNRAFAYALLTLCVLALLVTAPGCTPGQMGAYLGKAPASAPIANNGAAASTQPTSQPASKVEIILEKADPVVANVKNVATDVKAGADTASTLGVPDANWVSLGAGLIIGAAGLYQSIRKGSLANAAQNAVTTVVNAWHAEGTPGVTPAMQTALNTVKAIAPAVQLPALPPPAGSPTG